MAKARASLAGVTVSLGVMNFDVDLVPATRAKADKRAADNVSLKRCCPTCTTGTPIKQLLFCEHKHGPFPQNELAYAVETDKGLRKVTDDEATSVKAPTVEVKSVAFSVFPAGQVTSVTMPSGNVYRMRLPAKASKATKQAYALTLALVTDESLAFVAELVVKGATKLYRGVARDGMITLTELYRPSLFHEPDGADVACDEALVDVGRAMVAEMVADFDPEAWDSAAEARLVALQAAADAGETPPVPTEFQAATAAAEDLLSLLQAA